MPQLIKGVEDYVARPTKNNFLQMVEGFWWVLNRFSKFLPTLEETILRAGQMWDAWEVENGTRRTKND